MKLVRLAAVWALISVLFLTACGGKSSPAGGTSSAPQTIQNVVAKLHCTGYERDATIALGSKESGACDRPNGDTAQLYLMPSRSAGGYLIDLANKYGATVIKWYGNVPVVDPSMRANCVRR